MKAIFPIIVLLLTTMAGAEPMQKTLEPSTAKVRRSTADC